MIRKYFGTDGIRGRVNGETMTADTALRLGMAAGRYFRRGDHRHRVVIGKDTRLSGYMIEPALVAGFTSMGMDVFLFGPIPTPAVAFLTRSLRADIGVMISASHNGFEDNGIKLFGPDGFKLSDNIEYEIEQMMDASTSVLVPSAELGRAKRIDDSQSRYIEFAKRTFPRELTLDGIKLVVDCANGAAYKVAPTALWELGAEVVLVSGPTALNDPAGVETVRIESARDMLAAVETTLPADVFIAVAAVADWRPAEAHDRKIKGNKGDMGSLALVENPDIPKTISQRKDERPGLVIGFAAETHEVEDHARQKLAHKGCDWIVANDVSGDVMGGDENTIAIVSNDDVWRSQRASKPEIARLIAHRIAQAVVETC